MNKRKQLLQIGFWFYVLNTIPLLLIASRYFNYITDVDGFFTASYIASATISHFMSLSLVGYLLFIPLVLLFPYRKVAWISASIIATLGLCLLTIDTFVFDLYRMHINSFILELVFGGAASQIFKFHSSQYLMMAGTLLLYVSILFSSSYFFFKSTIATNIKRKFLAVTISLFFLLILFSHLTHAWAAAANYSPITKSSRFYPLYFPTTSDNLIYSLNLISEEEKKANLQLFNNQDIKTLNYPKHEILAEDSIKTNIILIILDSWHYKSFDSIITPNIYKFSKESEVYNHHYSGDNGTRTGIFSLFYGIPGLYWYNVLATHTSPVLIDQSLKNNYVIEAYPSAKITSPPFNKTVFSKVKNISVETKGRETYQRDAQLTENWLNFSEIDSIKGNQQPFFSFLFYDALHGYAHPSDYKGPFQPEWPYVKFELLNNDLDPTLFLNLYNNSAHFLDSLVGRVLNDIKSKGLLENSWIIITGDHGQEFNDNKKNYWGHGSNHTQAQLQVPLIIHKPNNSTKQYSHWTSHYDIVPTLMQEVFKVKNPIFDYSTGLNLKDTSNRENLIVGSPDIFSIIQKPNKINTVFYNGTFEITDFNLNTIPDAKLDVNIIDSILNRSNSFYQK